MVQESIQRLKFFFRVLTRRRLDALDLLESDHIRVEALFMQWRIARGKLARERTFEKIKNVLTVHLQIEESVFYPSCEKIPELKRRIARSYEEHKHCKNLLREISTLSLMSERATTKMKTLMSEIEQHVVEEENEIFPRVRALMRKNQLDRLNRDLRLAKQQWTQKIAA